MIASIDDAANYDALMNSAPVTLVDFFAHWCGPCRAVKPILDDMDKENEAANLPIKMFKVDVDANMELAMKMGVASMPTFLIYKNGKLEETIIGANVPSIKATIERLLADVSSAAPTDEGEGEEAVVVNTDDVKPPEEPAQ